MGKIRTARTGIGTHTRVVATGEAIIMLAIVAMITGGMSRIGAAGMRGVTGPIMTVGLITGALIGEATGVLIGVVDLTGIQGKSSLIKIFIKVISMSKM